MIKTIIFDFGGVLIDLDMEGCKAAFRQDLGYEKIDSLLDPCHQKGIVGDMEEGKISADEFRSAVLADCSPGTLPEDIDKAFLKIVTEIPAYKGRLLNHLAESYDIYMLSNNNPIVSPYLPEFFSSVGVSIEKVFIKTFLSYQMKMLKPAEAFYKMVMSEIECPTEEILFIDDSKKNVEAAIAAGLPSVYYEAGSDLAALLADVLDDPSIAEYGLNGVEGQN